MSTAPTFHRIAAGDYETADGRFRLYRLVNVNPPAWNVEETEPSAWGPDRTGLVVDGAASKRDALGFLADYLAGPGGRS